MTIQWSKRATWVLVAAVALCLVGAPSATLSQSPGPPLQNPMASGQLQMETTALPNGMQQIIVLDSAQKSLAVYFVDNGNLQLRSVRSLVWDLRMEEFNGAAPLPSELRRVHP